MASPDKTLSRRRFLQRAGGAAGALALPTIITGDALGAQSGSPASERIQFGVIGCGGRGNGNMGPHLKNIVAVCDVDKNHLGKAKDRVEKASGKTCAAYGDYRQLLERDDVDAVIISTPDHWHALPTIHACMAGKHVYVEKPMTLVIAEGREMVKAARKYNRIVQCGSQQRSEYGGKFRKACEYVRSGRLGKIHTVLTGINGVNYKGPPVPDSDPPPELDYDFWLGPAPWRPYNVKRVHYQFRFFWDYSGGQMTNWGAHHNDIAQWGLGMDDSGPIEVEGEAKYHPEGWYEVPRWFKCTYKYANGVTMYCGMDYPKGTTFIGDKGKLFVSRGKLQSDPADILDEPLTDDDVHLYDSPGHHKNWLQCIKTGKLPICDVEIGHRSATVCHLGNIAVRTKKKIRWDPVKEEILGDPETAKWVSKPYRAPWELPAL